MRPQYELSKTEFAVYRGEEYLMTGTKAEIATYLGVSYNTAKYYTSPAYTTRQQAHKPSKRQRLEFVKIDDDDDDYDELEE